MSIDSFLFVFLFSVTEFFYFENLNLVGMVTLN